MLASPQPNMSTPPPPTIPQYPPYLPTPTDTNSVPATKHHPQVKKKNNNNNRQSKEGLWAYRTPSQCQPLCVIPLVPHPPPSSPAYSHSHALSYAHRLTPPITTVIMCVLLRTYLPAHLVSLMKCLYLAVCVCVCSIQCIVSVSTVICGGLCQAGNNGLVHLAEVEAQSQHFVMLS